MMKELSHEVLFRKGKNSGEVVISQGYYFMGVESLIGQEVSPCLHVREHLTTPESVSGRSLPSYPEPGFSKASQSLSRATMGP